MPKRAGGAMHVATTRRHYRGADGVERRYETHLLRRSFREGGKPRNETLANLSHLPADTIEVIRRSLRGETLAVAGEGFDIARSRPHGHVAAVAAMARQLGLAGLLGPACVERDLAVALIVARVCRPGSKLATTRWWADTTLAPDLGVEGADTDDVYAAMDWLTARQDRIERRLAGRHLEPGGLVLYDLSGSWVEGRTCPLVAHGYSRDGKRGKPQICYGLVCDPQGRPVAVNVLAGDTPDSAAFRDAMTMITGRFGLDRAVLVGDRGMITTAGIAALREEPGLEWITALKAPQIKKLARQGAIQLSLFDQANLAEITAEDYPGERLVVCRNPALAADRARTRSELLAATDTELAKIAAAVAAGRLKDAGKIGVRVGKVINKRKMGKHYRYTIDHGQFTWSRDQNSIDAEAALDGIYVIRTSVDADRLDPAQIVESYKQLAGVEACFRSLKTVDLDIRPIHHRLEDRVRGHVLVCMLACYLVWHLRRAWAPLLFEDPHPPRRDDPVAPAARSTAAQRKASHGRTDHGEPAHSLDTLLDHLACLTRDRIRFRDSGVEIDKLAQPTPTQRRAFDLLDTAIPLKTG